MSAFIHSLKVLKWKLSCYKRAQKSITKMKSSEKKAIVFGSPLHSNLGDHAQTYCTIRWLKEFYNDYKVYVFDTPSIAEWGYKALYKIRQYVTEDDLLFLHSGYHMTDIYLYEEEMNRKVISLFPENKIIALPQTILFKNEDERNKTIKIYDNHKKFLLLCRDEISYRSAKKMFNNIKIICYPDIVTTMIGEYQYESIRKNILFCIRNDTETKYSKNDYAILESKLSSIGIVEYYDTTVNLPAKQIVNNREKILQETWKKFSGYKLVVTDRYHGTLFAMIAETPVIVVASSDHKLESGVKWFPPNMNNRIIFADNLSDVEGYAYQLLKKPISHYDYKYFAENYYDKLGEIIDEM